MEPIKIIECPRDAMHGIKSFIPTEKKLAYIQSLLGVGFDSIDFGSFVSPKAIPQMQDTAAVLSQLDLSQTKSKLRRARLHNRAMDGGLQGLEDLPAHVHLRKQPACPPPSTKTNDALLSLNALITRASCRICMAVAKNRRFYLT